jgi:tellurite methyltransferase
MTKRQNPNETATAYQAWDKKWQTQNGRADWMEPQSEVVEVLAGLQETGKIRALDLGCGIGRHALAMARAGLRVWACDMSDSGLAYAREQAAESGLMIRFKKGEMTRLPFEDGAFDYVLSWNVIYHGERGVVEQAIAEIHRVLKPGGQFQGTMLSKRHYRFGKGQEVAPDVWLEDNDTDGDHSHPHYFCNAAELVDLFKDFELLSLADREQRTPRSYHWVMLAEKI